MSPLFQKIRMKVKTEKAHILQHPSGDGDYLFSIFLLQLTIFRSLSHQIRTKNEAFMECPLLKESQTYYMFIIWLGGRNFERHFYQIELQQHLLFIVMPVSIFEVSGRNFSVGKSVTASHQKSMISILDIPKDFFKNSHNKITMTKKRYYLNNVLMQRNYFEVHKTITCNISYKQKQNSAGPMILCALNCI